MFHHIVPIDFDGDGQQDLVGANTVSPPRGATNHWYVFRRFNSEAPADTATTVTDGLGNMHQFHYKPLSALTADRYRNDAPVEYPAHELSGPWYVVTEHETSDGLGTSALFEHSYANGRIDKHETGDTKHGALLSREETTIELDDFGNTTNEQRALTDMDMQAPASPFAGQSWTTTATSTVTNDEATWCLGMTERTETNATSPNAPPLRRTKEATYDHAMCRLLETVDEPNQLALQSRSQFTYDACGNTNTVTLLGFRPDGSPLPPRVTAKDFGTRCQFPERTANALGQADTVEYNYAFGKPTRTIDANGVASESHVDAFGVLQREILADGVTHSYDFATCATEGCLPVPLARQRTTKTISDPQGAPLGREEIYADSLGRELQKTSAMVGGKSATTKSTYDARGCLVRRTRPMINDTIGSTNGATDFECDLALRPIRAARYRADGALERQERIRHLGLRTETIDTRGNVTTTQQDA